MIPAWERFCFDWGIHLISSSCSPSNVAGISAFGLLPEIAEDIAGADQLVKNYREAEALQQSHLTQRFAKTALLLCQPSGISNQGATSSYRDQTMRFESYSDSFKRSIRMSVLVDGKG